MTSVSPPPTDIFYNILFSDMPCYSDKKFKGFFHENGIELCDISGMSLKEMTAEVVNFLDDTDRTLPARVLVSIFNMTAGLVSNNILEDFAGQIMAAIERNSLNEVSFAQVLFRPAIEDSWDLIVQFNSHLKRLNKQNNVKTFDINNPIVKYFDKLKKDRRERVLKRFDRQALTDFHVKPFWNEHLLQTGLGHTLTPDGVRRVTNFIIKMYKTNFQFSSSEDYLETLVPRSLVETPWFRDIYEELKKANYHIYKGLRCLAVRNINEDVKVDCKIAPTVRVELTHNNEKAMFDNFPVDIKVSDRKVVILNHEVSNAISVEKIPTRIVKLTDNEPNIKNPPRRVLLNENSGLTIHTNGTGVQSDQIFKTDNFIDNNDSDMFDKREEIEALIRKNLALKLELEREKLELNNIALREGRIENHQQRDNEIWRSRSRSPEGYHEKQKGRGKNHRSRSRERDWDRPQNFRNRETEERYYESENTCREDANQTNDYDTLRSRNREYDRNNRSRSGDRSREYDPSFRDRSRDHDPYRERSREHDHSYRDRSREYDPSYTERSREYDPYRERSRVYDPSFREISGEYDPSHSERSREYDLSYRDRSREYDSYRERSREYDPCYRERSKEYDPSHTERSREYESAYRERSREYDPSYRDNARDNDSIYRARDQDPFYRDSSRENNPAEYREIPREYNSTHMDRSTEYDISYRERYPQEQERNVNRESRDYHQEDLNRESERNRQSYNNRSSNDNHRIDYRDERVEDENNHYRKDDYHRNESDHHSNRRYSDDRTDYQNRKRRHSHERRSKERRLKYSSPDSRKSTSPVSDIVLDMPVASSRSSREHERSKSSLNKVPEKQAEKVNPKLSNVKLPTPVSTFRTRGYINTSKSNKASNPYEEEKDEEQQQQDLHSPHVTNAAWKGPYPNSQGPGNGHNISQGPGNNLNLKNWIPPVTGPPGVRNLAPGILGQPPMIPAGPPQPYRPLVPPSQLLGPPPPLNVPAPAPPINVPDTQTLLELHGYVKKQQSTKTLSDYRINF